MTDNQKILDELDTIEAMASSLVLMCQSTRKLVKESVSTPPATGLSDIAIKARMDLRARIMKPTK